LTELVGIRVLIVEDDDDARELLVMILENAGCVVTATSSAKEALERLRDAQPQAIISDICMPSEDGYSLMRRIRARGRPEGGDVPSIALTACTAAVDRRNALEAGFTMHLSKPARAEELLATVRNLTRSHSS